jgi:hypothetical protein
MSAEAYAYLGPTPGATPLSLMLDQKGNLLQNLPGFVKKVL